MMRQHSVSILHHVAQLTVDVIPIYVDLNLMKILGSERSCLSLLDSRHGYRL